MNMQSLLDLVDLAATYAAVGQEITTDSATIIHDSHHLQARSLGRYGTTDSRTLQDSTIGVNLINLLSFYQNCKERQASLCMSY